MATTLKKPRILYFDVLNVLACFCVVLLHHNGLVHNYSANYKGAWTQSLVVEVLAYFAVPIFLMISGATLMEYRKRYDTKTFFVKRLSRVLVPFIIWSIIAFIYTVWRGQYSINLGSLTEIWNAFMFSKMMPVYWFFPIIISVYLAMPILSLLTKKVDRQWLWYIVGIGFVTYSVLPALTKLLGLGFNTGYQMPISGGGYIIYPILGYLLSTTKITRNWKIIVMVGAAICLAIRFLVTYILSLRDGATNDLLFSQLYFTAVIPAVAVFLIAQMIPWHKFIYGRGQSVLIGVSSCSLGIYLIHIFIMDAEIALFGLNGSQLLWRIGMPIVTYLTCLGIVWTVKSGIISKRLFP